MPEYTIEWSIEYRLFQVMHNGKVLHGFTSRKLAEEYKKKKEEKYECPACKGKGGFLCDPEDQSTQVECEQCDGKGYIERQG